MQAIIVAKNEEEREFLGMMLRHTGLSVARSSDVDLVKKSLREKIVDLLLVAAEDNTAVLSKVLSLREVSQSPLLLVIDQATEAEHCAFLDAGVDLVLQRPLSPRILTRYVRMFLRRSSAIPISVLPRIEAGGLVLDPASRTVSIPHDAPQHLTQLEFRLLYMLMTNNKQVIPTEAIVERVWGYDGDGNKELVRGLVRRLRRKIESPKAASRYIHNVPGIGYQFERTDSEEE